MSSSDNTAVLHRVNNKKAARASQRRYSRRSVRLSYASHNGISTRKPVTLKEGYLYKPSFFRFGGRRRRWCVLRSYSPSEASLDIFMDETKTRYKGSITLDRENNPAVFVKASDVSKKRKLNPGFMVLRVGKHTYHFSADTYQEMTVWCSLTRQAISDGSLFSATINEPRGLADGMVNVQFTSNYIALLCPVQELSIKRWRLDHITSFGQSGGMLTFECCGRCSDPNCNRASLTIVKEKPATILSLMEKSIRQNPNTNEIHYERSILGDIYHCTHHCGSPKLATAFSDTNLFSLSHESPSSMRRRQQLEGSLPPVLVPHETKFEKTHSNTFDSNDSGLPGTPHQLDDSPRSSNAYPSPTSIAGRHNFSDKLQEKIDHQLTNEGQDYRYTQLQPRAAPGSDEDEPHSPAKVTYTTVVPQNGRIRDHSSSLSSSGSGSVTYTTIASNKGKPLQLKYTRQHSPAEHTDSCNPPLPERVQSRMRPSSTSPTSFLSCSTPTRTNFGSIDSKELPTIPFHVVPPPPKLVSSKRVGTPMHSHPDRDLLKHKEMRLPSVSEREHPVSELGFKTNQSARFRSGTHVVHRELTDTESFERVRAASVSDVLDGSDSPVHHYRSHLKSTGGDEELFDYELSHDPFFRIGDMEYDETDDEKVMEICSNLADYRRHKEKKENSRSSGYCQPSVIDKVLSRVACDNVRGYAYKIMIPIAGDVVYDVPRREAPIADLSSVNANPDAPPKPLRIPGRSLEMKFTEDEYVLTGTQ